MAEGNKDKKPEIKKPKFSTYWIYGAIFLVFIGIQFFGSGSWAQPNITTQAEFERFLADGDVEKVEVVNKKIAKVYLTAEAKAKSIHSSKKKNSFLESGVNEATYQFEFGDLQNFENSIEEIKKNGDITTQLVWNTESNMWGEVLIGLLPFIVIIGIWIFIMRRMSSGAGGGAGGQIF